MTERAPADRADTEPPRATQPFTGREGARQWIRAHRTPIALTAVLLTATALRFYRLGFESIWQDEASSFDDARRGWLALIEDVRKDNHAPLYFLLLKSWIAVFGTTEVGMRSLSVLAGLAGIVAVFLLARELAGPNVAIVSSALLAISPFHIYYSQEARMYALLFLFATLSTHAFSRAFVASRTPTAFVYYVASSVAMLYLHFNAIFVLAAHGLYFLASRLRSRGPAAASLPRFALATALIALLYAPWGLVTIQQVLTKVRQGWWVPEPDLGSLRYTYALIAGVERTTIGVVAAVAIGLLLIAAVLSRRLAMDGGRANPLRRPWVPWSGSGLLIALGGCSVLLPFVISKITTPIYLERATIPAVAAFAVLLACGLLCIRSKVALVAVASLIIAATTLTLRTQYVVASKDNWRAAVPFIERTAAPRPVVVFHGAWTYPPFGYYQRRADVDVVRTLPNGTVHPASLRRAAEEGAAWLVVSNLPAGERGVERLVSDLASSVGPLRDAQRFTGIRVYRFERRD